MKVLAFALSCACGLSAAATTFTVINTNDAGSGSLREAITLANTTPGPNLVAFNIPGTNVHTIAPLSALPVITNTMTIDGYTQPGSQTGNYMVGPFPAVLRIRLDGAQLSGLTTLLKLSGSGHVVRGLVIVRSPYRGIHLENCSNTSINGNWIGLDVDNIASGNAFEGVYLSTAGGSTTGNTIGGMLMGEPNIISGNRHGIYLFGTSTTANTIAGNLIGTDATGSLGRGNLFNGIFIHAGINNVIGGSGPFRGNIISANGTGNTAGGIYLLGGTATTIQNNYIGTGLSGGGDLGNGAEGIGIQSSTVSGCTITDNLICNNRGNGITVLGSTNVIKNNAIGVILLPPLAIGNSAPVPMGNQGAGISIGGGTHNTIGGIGAGNLIRFNLEAGVEMTGGSNNAARANLISDNRGLPVDLGATGVNTNDPGDLDFGANGLLNYPVLTNALNTDSNLLVAGYLDSVGSASFTVDFYAASGLSLLGQPQAQQYLGSVLVTTDSSGIGVFDLSLPVTFTPGWHVTATTTDAFQSTSEFAAPLVPANSPPPPPVLSIGSFEGAVLVSWLTTNGPYELQTTYSLEAPVQWQAVTNVFQDGGTWKLFSLPPTALATNQFFRLKRL